MYMEEVNSITVSIIEETDSILGINGLVMTTDMEDALFTKVAAIIEELAGYPDYRNYN